MGKYKFNSSGTQLLELAMVVLSNIGESSWMFINGSRTNFGSLVHTTETFDSRIYSNQEDFIKMLDRLRSGEHDIIEDAQTIVKMFQNTDDIEGQKFLLDIINGIDKNKIVGDKTRFDLNMCKVYHGFLYKDSLRNRGFRVNNPEINKYLLVHVLEFINPSVEEDFKVLVDNAKSFGVSDEDIEKIYKMLEHKYSRPIPVQQGTNFADGIFTREYRLETMQKSFEPVQKRLEIKTQQEQQLQSDEEMPQTLEAAWKLIRDLRKKNEALTNRIEVLEASLKIQGMQPENINAGVKIPPEQVKAI